MTFDDYKASLKKDTPPEGLNPIAAGHMVRW